MASRLHYGHYLGGDPRAFAPDPECSTEAQRQAHSEACAAWARGERVEADKWAYGLGTLEYDWGDEPCGAPHPFTTQACELGGGHEGRHSAEDGRATWCLEGEEGWPDV